MDLSNFPESESAIRMMGMISQIYDESYVGKWIFEVMGFYMDYASEIIKGISTEAFPETSARMIAEWESLYGITPNPDATLDERREALRAKRVTRTAMNPARIESIISGSIGRNVTLIENTAPSKYEISVYGGTNVVDIQSIRSIVNKVKQSNKSVDITFGNDANIKIHAEVTISVFPHVVPGTARKSVSYPGGSNVRRL